MRSGRPPKDANERRNRNKPTHETIVLPREGRRGRAPGLKAGKRAFSEDTKKWWSEIWHSPMATMWLDEDVHALTELAILRDEFLITGNHRIAAEVRQRSGEFGLTVAGRRALRWVIQGEDERGGDQKADGRSGDKVTDIRSRVKAVDSDAVAGS